MVYTETEKRRLDNIYNAFSEFIKRQDYFDILYSEKVGYVKLWVKQSIIESPSVFTTAEEMMEALCYEVINEVIFSQNNPSHHLTAEAEAKSRSLLISITMQMEENREYYRDYAEKYVQEFREKYDED